MLVAYIIATGKVENVTYIKGSLTGHFVKVSLWYASL